MIQPSRRRALRGLGLGVLLGLGSCEKATTPLPPILLVSVDTVRADHLGLYGYERDTSPFLDRFGAQGIVFESAFTSAAWTLIAHMTMLTGLYPEQHGVTEGTHALSPAAPLLAERLSGVGYQTLGLFRPGWIHARHGFERGFDVFRTHQSVEEAEAHLTEELARLDPKRPVFLFLHLFDVHNDPATKTPPSVYSTPEAYRGFFMEDAQEQLGDETYLSLKKRPLVGREREAMVALYDEGIRHVDAGLERIFAHLEAEGLLDEALVIITSDHGESLAQRGRLTGHGGPWQEGLHIPLLMQLPNKARAGERIVEVAHLVDVPPTVLGFIGLPADPQLPGRSLLEPLPAQRVVTGGNDPVEFAVRWPEKMMRFGKSVGRTDLEEDPGEFALVGATSEEFARLKSALGLAPGSFHEPVPIGPISSEERADLEALGYGGGHEDD